MPEPIDYFSCSIPAEYLDIAVQPLNVYPLTVPEWIFSRQRCLSIGQVWLFWPSRRKDTPLCSKTGPRPCVPPLLTWLLIDTKKPGGHRAFL